MFSILPYRSECMAPRRQDPFMDDFFRPFFGGMAPMDRMMKVDVRDEGDHYLLEADMPGMKKENVKVSVENGVLTLSAEASQNEDREEKGHYVYRERRMGQMSRSFNLEGIREDGIEARFEDGVLKLTLPKEQPETQQTAREIEIH